MKTISIVNQKGGVCKSTTSQAISEIFNEKQKKTLLIDLDPQSNLSFAAGINMINVPTIYNVMRKEFKADDVLQPASFGDILPSNILLSGADMEFTATGREYLLKEAISGMKKNYEYIVIDCPPSLSILTVNALTASDFVVIPSLADVFSLQGMSQLNNTIKNVARYCNSNLKIAGILLTKFIGRNTISQIIKNSLEEITRQMDTKLFDTSIRRSVALQEAQLQQKPLLEYARGSNAVEDYINFISELEEVING